jgi:hypothetical protein
MPECTPRSHDSLKLRALGRRHSGTLAQSTLTTLGLVPVRGYPTPEEAVVADMDIPERFFTIIGSRVRGDSATVWVLTNDREPFEEYECDCQREAGLWREIGGSGGFSPMTPLTIRRRAREIRSRSR